MVKPWALLIFLLANGGDGAWVSTPPRQNYGYSSYKNNYQSTSLNSITSQLKDLNWKVSKYKEQLYKAEDEIDNLWVSEVGQDYKIQSLEGKDKQHEGRLYSTEVNNARQDEEIDSLETKTAVNSGQISDNDDDILDLQAKQDELCTTVGDAGDSVNDPSGLVGQVAALETNCCGEAVLGQDIADLQTNCCGEAGLGQDIADLQDNCCGEAGLGQDIADLQTNCCGEASLGQDIADLQTNCCGEASLGQDIADLQTDCCGEAGLGQAIADLQMNCCDEGNARLTALENNCCNEGDARLTALETTVDTATTGLVDKVAALEDDLDKEGGVLDCLVDLKGQNCLLQVQLEMLTAVVLNDGPILSCPECDKDCSGDDLPGQSIAGLGDWEACTEKCRMSSVCKYWTYNSDTDVCYLKSACSGLTGYVNAFSGTRSCKLCFDECKASNHYLLDADSRRVTNAASVFQDVESSCCYPTSPDWVVDESNANWYKFDDNSRMHETNTAWPRCGGLNVIRLNGIHPTEIGQYYAQFIDDTGRTYEGMMTNCGEFFVYLLPDTRTSSRYCSADVGSNKGLSKLFRSNTTLPIPFYHTIEEKMKIWEEMKKDV